MTTIIEVRNLAKHYGKRTAVADVSFGVERGEIFGILGPNGAGKTTSVECVAGLRSRDGGQIRVLGVDPRGDRATVRRQVGVQLQHAELPEKLRVTEALELFASFYQHPADPRELIDVLGLTGSADSAWRTLSGGQKQRLSIALALIGNPAIAILDELTTGLDPAARRETWDLIEAIRDRGTTILLVTHFMQEAERLCDRLAVQALDPARRAPAHRAPGGDRTGAHRRPATAERQLEPGRRGDLGTGPARRRSRAVTGRTTLTGRRFRGDNRKGPLVNAFSKLARTEARLFLRTPMAVTWTALLPVLALIALGSILAIREDTPTLHGISYLDAYLPILMGFSLCMSAVNLLPPTLALYREKGHPAAVVDHAGSAVLVARRAGLHLRRRRHGSVGAAARRRGRVRRPGRR